MSHTNQTYTLVTIADLLRVVTADNVEALSADIRGLLVNATLTKVAMSLADPEGKVDFFKDAEITWTDDNLNQQRFTASSDDGKSLEFVLKGTEGNEYHAK
jgi:hypothetical protein